MANTEAGGLVLYAHHFFQFRFGSPLYGYDDEHWQGIQDVKDGIRALPPTTPITLVDHGFGDPICRHCPRNPEYNTSCAIWGLCGEEAQPEETRILQIFIEEFGKRPDEFTVEDFGNGKA